MFFVMLSPSSSTVLKDRFGFSCLHALVEQPSSKVSGMPVLFFFPQSPSPTPFSFFHEFQNLHFPQVALAEPESVGRGCSKRTPTLRSSLYQCNQRAFLAKQLYSVLGRCSGLLIISWHPLVSKLFSTFELFPLVFAASAFPSLEALIAPVPIIPLSVPLPPMRVSAQFFPLYFHSREFSVFSPFF